MRCQTGPSDSEARGKYFTKVLLQICALVLLALGLWMINACTFLDELLRNRLYMDTGYTIVVASCFISALAVFGCVGKARGMGWSCLKV